MFPSRELTNREKEFQKMKEHCKMMLRDEELSEEFYQYCYDYFAGRTSVKMIPLREKGLIFTNFYHFLRLSNLTNKITKRKAESIFVEKTNHLNMSNIRYVTYNEFVDLLHQIAIEYFPNIPGAKRLKKFTKLIYASVMHSIPDIASYFHETKRRHQRTTMIYAPRLFVFTTEAPPEESPSASMLSDRHYDGNMMNNRSTMPLKGLDRRNISLFPDNDKSSADTTQIMMEAKPNETRKSISDIKPRKKRKSVFKKACGSCLANFAKKNEKCIKKILIVPNKLGDWIDAGVKRLGQHLGFDVEDLDEIEEKDETKAKLEAPPWPVVVEIMLKNIPEAEKIYREKEKNKGLRLMCNLTNIMTIYGKFMIREIYNYSSAAFMPEIPWFSSIDINLSISSYLNILNGEGGSSKFQRNFWIAFGMICGYIFFGTQAIQALRKGTLGEDENGNPAKFPKRQYLVVLGVQILGGTFFSQIMKYIVDAFVCNYDVSPWVLARDSSIECLGDEHFVYIILGVLALLIYYPMCTFMFPNFQFKNKMLDLKYNPSWIVILIQIKLTLACIRSFFKASTPENILIKLIATIVVLFVLALANLYIKPCLVKKFNVIDVGAYLLAAYVTSSTFNYPKINLISLFVYETGNNTLGCIFLFPGMFAIIAVTIYIVKLLYGKKIVRVKRQANDHKLEFDESKRVADNPDVEKTRKLLKQKERKEKLNIQANSAREITTDNSHMRIDLSKTKEQERPDEEFFF